MSSRHRMEEGQMGGRLRPQRRLATVLLLAFVVVALVPTVVLAVFSSIATGRQGRQSAFDRLNQVATSKSEDVAEWYDATEATGLLNLTNEASYIDAVDVLTHEEGTSEFALGELGFVSHSQLLSQPEGPFNRVMLADVSGNIVLTTDGAAEGGNVAGQPFFEEGRLQTARTAPLRDPLDGEWSVYYSAPVNEAETGVLLGVLISRTGIEALEALAAERAALGETGEVLLVTPEREFVTAVRFGDGSEEADSFGISRALGGVSEAQIYEDYRGETVLGAYRWLEEPGIALVVKQDQAEIQPLSRALVLAIVGVAAGSGVAALLIGLVLARRITSPVSELTESALRIAEGDLAHQVESDRADELGSLASAFNEMATRVQGVVGTLEERVAVRTRDLETIADISRAITGIQSSDLLLENVVELIRERFGFYHAQVFLLDEQAAYAVLRESTGDVGRALLEQGHRLEVGSESVIGKVTGEGTPVIALDTDTDPTHRRNELLPDTRSEMALPLRIGERIIGALDVQSTEQNAFGEDNIRAFQTMADQLAIALDNARLFEASRAALAEVETLNRQLTGQAWGQFAVREKSGVATGFRMENGELFPMTDNLNSDRFVEDSDEAVVIREDGQNGGFIVSIPIRVRGELIGAFEFGGEGVSPPHVDDIALIEAVTDRVEQALENRRLFEQTQRVARREQLVNQITSRIVGSTDVDEILQTTVKELGRVIRSPRTRIQLYGEGKDEQ